MIDLHVHILPGLDDGCASADESVELARALASAGVRVAGATPHVSARYPTTASAAADALAAVRAAVASARIDLDVVAGAEIALDRVERLADDDLGALALGGGDAVLVEFPADAFLPGVAGALDALARRGFRPVLAHPERNPVVQAAPHRLSGLVETGCLVQVTAAALLRPRTSAGRAAATLVRSGLAHMLASDVHRPGSRPPLADAARVLDRRLFAWLVQEVPASVLRGSPLPRRPRRLRGLRLRAHDEKEDVRGARGLM